jgi:5-methylcytosine-specific restriction endonuclease McrA
MPRTCTICTHPQREAIDRALVAGQKLADFLIWQSEGKNLRERVQAYCRWWSETAGIVDLFWHMPGSKVQAAVRRYIEIDESLRLALDVPRNWPRDPISQKGRRKVIKDCNYTCQYCGGKGDTRKGPDGRSWHIDHIVPVALSGDNSPDNLTLACATCNGKKGVRPAWSFATCKK